MSLNDLASDVRNGAKKLEGDLSHTSEAASAELARLRAQVERLMQDRVGPALSDAADKVQDYAHRARAGIETQTDALSATIRERPIAAVAIGAGVGFLIGRLLGAIASIPPRDHR